MIYATVRSGQSARMRTNASGWSIDVNGENYAVDLVIIALPWERSAEIFALTRRLQWIAADVVVPFVAAGLRPQFAPPTHYPITRQP